jgi:hypothetical protein
MENPNRCLERLSGGVVRFLACGQALHFWLHLLLKRGKKCRTLISTCKNVYISWLELQR